MSSFRFRDLEELAILIQLNLKGLQEILHNAAVCISHKLGWRRKQSEARGAFPAGFRTLITGANQGIGRATAAELMKRGSDVVLACRNTALADAAADELRQLVPYSGCSLGSVEVASLDLASLASVKNCVRTLLNDTKRPPFAVIVCNAGIMAPPHRIETEDGYEQQFQVNYLSHFLLTHELLRGFKSRYMIYKIEPRVVFLSSLTHFGARLSLDDDALQSRTKYDAFKAYCNCKLCIIMAANEFHRRMTINDQEFPRGSAVSVHPGIVDSFLARQFFINEVPSLLRPAATPLLERLVFPLALRTKEEAANGVVFASTAPAETVGGNYIENGAVARSSGPSHDPVLARKLWDLSLQLAGL